jgi:hypothetical protein
MAAQEIVDLWPDNAPYVDLFRAMQTQWRFSFGGASGLDYGALEPTLRLLDVPHEKWSEMFSAIRIMEIEALEQMRINADARGEHR